MPRLLPRLLKILQDAPEPSSLSNGYTRYKKRVSMKNTIPETPTFSPEGRTHSILFDDANPITQGHLYNRHKSLPPRVRLVKPLQDTGGHDHPREMTNEEREWWSSPYLRMLTSPLRECQITRKKLPRDFLIRLAPVRLPASQGVREQQTLVPDGVEHPKFNPRRSTPACYIVCWKDAVPFATNRIPLRKFSPSLTVPPLLSVRIGYQLRLRVLQELDLLTKRLAASPLDDPAATVLRRLTRSEWNVVRQTNSIPYKDAVALMVVPPVNQNPDTKERPQPSAQLNIADIVQNDTDSSENSPRPLPPLSVLHPVTDDDIGSPLLPNAKAPLYHGLSLFPARPQRAALHKALCKLLEAERRARSRALPTSDSSQYEKSARARGDAKGSHAFLLCSNQHTANRADVVPLAIALWRLRMWEGQAYGDAAETSHWEVGAGWRLSWANQMY
ncbi:hypothetical protein DEU56DRAFT_150776 [Suillus clintonianus]|uniref:uncharacterized protein n=1 Tax=Suillus clintonianus TaxID=1904413 RepID=UPI001B867DFE|nr:uncharacterized protein DEU56DRAFT_150776 [Suillus clintonianus]KAG2146693.1 hypothetical protein DEU56DRAFT_150776 [Suillus clintonianus]